MDLRKALVSERASEWLNTWRARMAGFITSRWPLAAQPMAELHVLQDRQEVLAEAAAAAEVRGANRERVGREIVRVRATRLAVMNEHRLEATEEPPVGRRAGIGAADHGPGAGARERGGGARQGVFLEQAVGVGEEQDLPAAVGGADVARPRRAAVALEPHEAAGITADDRNRIVPGGVVHHDHLEPG